MRAAKLRLAFRTALSCITAIIATTMPTAAQENTREVSGAKLWSLPIPELKFSDVKLEEAAKQTMAAFRAAHPTENGIKGVVVSLPENDDVRVTFDLRDAPVGLAFKYLADLAFCVVTERDGIVALSALNGPGNKPVILVFVPTVKVKAALGLRRSTNSARLTAALNRVAVKASLLDRAEYSASRDLLFFEGPGGEMAFLRSVIELIERGAVIKMKK